MNGRWQLQVLGGLRISSGDCVVNRLPGRAPALLLTRLALQPTRSHAREELVELLWPGVSLEVGRNRLRQSLSTLRYLLEPPGSLGVVLIADRSTVRLYDGALDCDAVDFELAVKAHRDSDAIAFYRGDLLPGFYEPWVVEERTRLAALRDRIHERRPPGTVPGDDNRPFLSRAPSAMAAPQSGEPHVAQRRLPGYLSRFFGREAESSRLCSLLETHRLITVTGVGGCGKTRLAVEVGRRSAGFDEVLFVALSDCKSGVELPDRLRAAVGLPVAATPAGTAEGIASRLAGRRTLLVFDNFEQLVDSGGPAALARLLADLPTAHALVTSRRALQLAGEQELVLQPLAVPDADAELTDAARNDAMALFVDRARGVRGEFRLTRANLPDLLTICRALEGLPLALEIAASRVRTLSPGEMRGELERRFRLLVRPGRSAGVDPRHGSLHAAIDWSWRLLAPIDQSFLVDLSVFRGGFCGSDAAAVTGVGDAHAPLDRLVTDSLVWAGEDASTEGGTELRFDMLQAVREFVAEHMDAARRLALRRAHRAHFLSVALAFAQRHQPMPGSALPNHVEALQTAVDDDELGLAVALSLALKSQWESVGTPPDVLAMLIRAARTAASSTPRLSPFLSMLARLLFVSGRSAEALDFAARAIELAGEDDAHRAEALFAHTRVEWVWRRDAARVIAPAREGVQLARRAGATDIEASAESLLGAITLWGLDDPVEAEAIYERAKSLYLAGGNASGALQASHGRMGCLYVTGRHDEVIDVGLLLEDQAEAVKNVEAQVMVLNLLTASYAARHRFAEALDAARRQTRLACRHHKIYNVVHALWSQGRFLARLRCPNEAGVLMAFSQRYWRDHFGELPPAERSEMRRVVRLIELQIGTAPVAALWARGLALTEARGLALGCGR